MEEPVKPYWDIEFLAGVTTRYTKDFYATHYPSQKLYTSKRDRAKAIKMIADLIQAPLPNEERLHYLLSHNLARNLSRQQRYSLNHIYQLRDIIRTTLLFKPEKPVYKYMYHNSEQKATDWILQSLITINKYTKWWNIHNNCECKKCTSTSRRHGIWLGSFNYIKVYVNQIDTLLDYETKLARYHVLTKVFAKYRVPKDIIRLIIGICDGVD